METPVLSKRQKKLSLSAKKKKKEIIKNVVANPYGTYWPLITDRLDELKTILEENLPRVRAKKINVPWNILKNVAKEERRAVRNEYLKKNTPSVTAIDEPNLVFGVNEVTKSLEINSCSIVLIAEVNPRLLVQHILDLAVLYTVPILVVPGIKQILEKHCGLESMAIAIKKSATLAPNLGKIVDIVSELSLNYPANKEHINTKRNLVLQNSVEDDDVKEINMTQPKNQAAKVTKCHLHRSSSIRAFIPKISMESAIKNTDSIEFMSFGDVEIVENKSTNSVPYKPLVVKRLKGNKNRVKNNVEQLKRKRK